MGRLGEACVRKLDELNFDWSNQSCQTRPVPDRFHEMYPRLKALFEERGYIRLREEDGKDLFDFVKNCRQRQKRGNIEAECVQKLDDIGFRWSVKRTTPHRPRVSWEERLEQCRRFKTEHGHLRISGNDPELGIWAQLLRNANSRLSDGKSAFRFAANKSLTPTRIATLSEMGFVWRLGSRPSSQKPWEVRLEEFRAWKAEHGHPYVPQPQYGKADDPKWLGLGCWVAHQRLYYRYLREGREGHEVMSEERAKLLDEAGFAWNATRVSRVRRKEEHVEKESEESEASDEEGHDADVGIIAESHEKSIGEEVINDHDYFLQKR